MIRCAVSSGQTGPLYDFGDRELPVHCGKAFEDREYLQHALNIVPIPARLCGRG